MALYRCLVTIEVTRKDTCKGKEWKRITEKEYDLKKKILKRGTKKETNSEKKRKKVGTRVRKRRKKVGTRESEIEQGERS